MSNVAPKSEVTIFRVYVNGKGVVNFSSLTVHCDMRRLEEQRAYFRDVLRGVGMHAGALNKIAKKHPCQPAFEDNIDWLAFLWHLEKTAEVPISGCKVWRAQFQHAAEYGADNAANARQRQAELNAQHDAEIAAGITSHDIVLRCDARLERVDGRLRRYLSPV